MSRKSSQQRVALCDVCLTGLAVLNPNLIGAVAVEQLNLDFMFHQFLCVGIRKISDPGPTHKLNKKDHELA